MNCSKFLWTVALVAAGLANIAHAAGQYQVTGAGATLFVDFFAIPGITNDQIDVDGDGLVGFNFAFPDQLGVSEPSPFDGDWNTHWKMNYRSVGSTNGFQEFVDSQLYYAAQADSLTVKPLNFSLPNNRPSEAGILNQRVYWENRTVPPPGATAYTGTTPNPLTDGFTLTGTPNNYALSSIDYSSTDVPALWAVNQGGAAGRTWNAKPGTTGYGNNPNPAVIAPTQSQTNTSNKLKDLFDREHNGTAADGTQWNDNGGSNTIGGVEQGTYSDNVDYGQLNLNTPSTTPDERTIFDNVINWSPIVYIANHGTGVENITQENLQHLMTTGRLADGTNLVGVTRDSGSGTRNGMMNTTGIDPSWGRGDNYGAVTPDAAQDLLGPNFTANNKEGSSRMEGTVQNHRLAIGYTGLFGASRAIEDANGGRYEVLNVDFIAGNTFVRPDSINKIVNTDDPNNGWLLGGPQTLSTVGDAWAGDIFVAGVDASTSLTTGNGFSQNYTTGEVIEDPADVALLGSFTQYQPIDPDNIAAGLTPAPANFDYVKHKGKAASSSNPKVDNVQTALFLRNILASIALFNGSQTNDDAEAMPGEVLAENFTITEGIDAMPQLDDPTDISDTSRFVSFVQSELIAANAFSLDAYATNSDNRVPTRTAAINYTDNNGVASNLYRAFNGATTFSYGVVFSSNTNDIAGDFNGDNVRNASDLPALMLAWRARHNSESYITLGLPADMVPELMGDFNGDGNFDAEDVRYFADGLYSSSPLDRKAGFIAVDEEWDKEDNGLADGSQTNFFGVAAYSTGENYSDGDARADIAGSTAGPSMGWAPVGADGFIDALDIDYVYAQFNNNAFLGSVTGDTAFPDGQANWDDIDDAVFFDLSADMTGDLIVDQFDIDEIVQSILGTDYGDVDLDGDIDGDDELIVNNNQGQLNLGWAFGDLNGDGITDALDQSFFDIFSDADFNVDGFVDGADFSFFLGEWGTPGGPPFSDADFNTDGEVDGADFSFFLGEWNPAPPGINLIPEPASIALLGLGGLTLLSRRRIG